MHGQALSACRRLICTMFATFPPVGGMRCESEDTPLRAEVDGCDKVDGNAHACPLQSMCGVVSPQYTFCHLESLQTADPAIGVVGYFPVSVFDQGTVLQGDPLPGQVTRTLARKAVPCILWLLVWIGEALLPFWLSFLAMTGAALLRLLLFGAPLRGGSYNADPLLRAARGTCRGASFAFLFTACLMPAAYGIPMRTGSGTCRPPLSPNFVDPVMEAQFAFQAEERGRVLEHNFAIAEIPQYEHRPPDPLDVNDVAEARVAIRIMLMQQVDYYVSMWVHDATTADEVHRHVTNVMLQNVHEFRAHAAVPQLPDDVLTYVVVPAWWSVAGKVGIVFEHVATGGEPFLGVVPAECTLSDIYIAYGGSPPDGMRFYLQNSEEPLPRQGTFFMADGAVVRLRDTALHRIELPTVQEALRDLYWIRDIEHLGMPSPPEASGMVLAFSPMTAKVIEVAANATVPQLNAAACEALDMDCGSVALVVCTTPLTHASYCGRPFEGIIAVHPRGWMHHTTTSTGVFLDPRDLGESLTFHVFGSNQVSDHEIIDVVESSVPADLTVKISGTAGPATRDGCQWIVQGALLIAGWTMAGRHGVMERMR